MSDDAAGAIVVWFLMVLAAAVVLPVVAAWCVVVMAGRAVVWLARSGRQLARGPEVQRELQRVSHERNEAIRDVLAIAREGERAIRALADEYVVEGSAEEWSGE